MRSHVPKESVDSDSDSSTVQESAMGTSGRLIRNRIARQNDSSSEEWVESPVVPSTKSDRSRAVLNTSPRSSVTRLSTDKDDYPFVNAKVVKGDKIGRVLNYIT